MELFFSGIAIQNYILLITIIVSLFIYWRNRVISFRNAANLVVLQIKDIEKNIEYLKMEGVYNNSIINEQATFNSVLIFEQNYWDLYRHLLFNYITPNDYEVISKFYSNAIAFP